MSLSNLMKEYFDGSDDVVEISNVHLAVGVPIVPFKETWEVVNKPQRLLKDFKFKSFFHLKSFLNEVLEYQEELQHHATITVSHLSIRIEVFTHDVEEVTEIDLEYAKAVDLIYEDIQYYESDYDRRIRSY
jgi:4a-hydroxytetrahydrobiopterin dehydratase